MGDSGVGTKDLYAGHQYGYFDLGIYRRTVVPKLGAMPPPPGGHGAIAGEPWAHIEKIYLSRIDTEKWTF